MPRDVDELSFPELFDILYEGYQKQKSQIEHDFEVAYVVATAVLNWGGPRRKGWRSKDLDYLWKQVRGKGTKRKEWTDEEISDGYATIRKNQELRRQRRIERGEPTGESVENGNPDN